MLKEGRQTGSENYSGEFTLEGVSVSWNSAKARRMSGFACRPMLMLIMVT